MSRYTTIDGLTMVRDEAEFIAKLLEARFPWLGSDDPESAANVLQAVADLHAELRKAARG